MITIIGFIIAAGGIALVAGVNAWHRRTGDESAAIRTALEIAVTMIVLGFALALVGDLVPPIG